MSYLYVVFKSSKNETWLHDFIFMLIWYFIWAILLRKSSKSRGFGKNLKMGMVIKGGCL